jgi:hypothetical protein
MMKGNKRESKNHHHTLSLVPRGVDLKVEGKMALGRI